jgi:predicted solute-binding protein
VGEEEMTPFTLNEDDLNERLVGIGAISVLLYITNMIALFASFGVP